MTRRLTRSLVFAVFCCLPVSTILAHPGHGTTEGHSPEHYLLEPLHVVPLALVITAVGIATVVAYRRRSR